MWRACASGALQQACDCETNDDETTDKTTKDTIQMPKMKTKSGAKKRFKMTASGKVKAGQAGKRHGMIKRTAKFVQKARGTGILNDSDAKIVKKYMPYAR